MTTFLMFITNVGPWLMTISETLATLAKFVGELGLKFPDVMEFLYRGVLNIFDMKDSWKEQGMDPETIRTNVLQAKEELVEGTMQEFHGSGAQLSEQLVRGGLEGLVGIVKAHRYTPTTFQQKDVTARQLGYLVSPDLEIAKQTMPWLFGVRP